MLSKDEFINRWYELHDDVGASPIINSWLNISYRLGLICTLLRISPNALTLVSLFGSLITVLTIQTPWAIIFLCFSLFIDGIDGSVAIFQKRDNNWGATIESVVVRIIEALWCLAIYLIGVSAWIPISLWCVASFQAYARTKLSSLKIVESKCRTPMKHITRAGCLFIGLLASQYTVFALEAIFVFALLLEIYSFVSVVIFGRNQLLQ